MLTRVIDKPTTALGLSHTSAVFQPFSIRSPSHPRFVITLPTHPVVATFSAVGLLSRAFNYTLLGGTWPGVTGIFAGLGLGLGLDALVRQLDSHQFARNDRETWGDHAQVGAILGTTTVLKNAWLQNWKGRYPYHWTSRVVMAADSLLSKQLRQQVMSAAKHIGRHSHKRGSEVVNWVTGLKDIRQQWGFIQGQLSDPTLLRKRLGIKSMRNTTFNFLDNGYNWFKPWPRLLQAWKALYMPLLITSSAFRSTPIASRMHANITLASQFKPFWWKLSRMLPGLALDILFTSLLFFGLHTLLHTGHYKKQDDYKGLKLTLA